MKHQISLLSITLIITMLSEYVYAEKCNHDMIRKMTNAGFSTSEIEKLCGATDLNEQQNGERSPFSGTWVISKILPRSDYSYRSFIRNSHKIPEKWVIDFSDGRKLAIYRLLGTQTKDLKPTDVTYDESQLSFSITETHEPVNRRYSERRYSERYYDLPFSNSRRKETTLYRIKLVNRDEARGEWSSETLYVSEFTGIDRVTSQGKLEMIRDD